jgi:dTDP-4-amino-4,6-dideoxygalactose transaminase
MTAWGIHRSWRELHVHPAQLEAAGADAPSRYEAQFAATVGAPHAIAYGFARHALIGILRGLGIGAGDCVLLSPLTCRVVVLALLAERVQPVYCDIAAGTLNLDPRALAPRVVARAKGVLFQCTFGGEGGLADVAQATRMAGLPLIEDRAQCMPGEFAPHGVAAVFSNNLRKPLPAAAGGFAVTRDAALALKLRAHAASLPRVSPLADFRRRAEALLQRSLLPSHYWALNAIAQRTSATYRRAPLEQEIAAEIGGTAYRPSAAQSAEGERWLTRVRAISEVRTRAAATYAAALETQGAHALARDLTRGALYYFPLRVENKSALLAAAMRDGIEIVAWPIAAPIFPLTTLEEMRPYGYEPGSCPVAERVARELVGLPTDGGVSPSRVVEWLGRQHARLERDAGDDTSMQPWRRR